MAAVITIPPSTFASQEGNAQEGNADVVITQVILRLSEQVPCFASQQFWGHP